MIHTTGQAGYFKRFCSNTLESTGEKSWNLKVKTREKRRKVYLKT
jgi:hypothetical protein